VAYDDDAVEVPQAQVYHAAAEADWEGDGARHLVLLDVRHHAVILEAHPGAAHHQARLSAEVG
jgi:hypothetical protein